MNWLVEKPKSEAEQNVWQFSVQGSLVVIKALDFEGKLTMVQGQVLLHANWVALSSLFILSHPHDGDEDRAYLMGFLQAPHWMMSVR